MRALHAAFMVHRKPARRLVAPLLRLASTSGLPPAHDDFVVALVHAWRDDAPEEHRQLDDTEAFVLSRALIEVLRHATLYGSPQLGTPAPEDALVRLVPGCLRAPRA